MISSDYDILEFADFVNSKNDIFELIEITKDELCQAGIMSVASRRNIPKKRESDCHLYIREVKGFLSFLRTGCRPSGMRCFELFRPVCQKLIKEKVFKPETMDAFYESS